MPYCPRERVFGILTQEGSSCSQKSSTLRLIVIIAAHFYPAAILVFQESSTSPPVSDNYPCTSPRSRCRWLPTRRPSRNAGEKVIQDFNPSRRTDHLRMAHVGYAQTKSVMSFKLPKEIVLHGSVAGNPIPRQAAAGYIL